MKTKKTIINLIVLSISFITSCKKTEVGPQGETGAQGSQGPSLTGNIKGYVNHYDYNNSKILSDLAGDSIFIDGTSMVAVTNASGSYSFTNLTTGTYNFTIKRLGYGTDKLQSLQFVGGGDSFHNINLAKTPTLNITTISATQTSTSASVMGINITGTVTAQPFAQTVIIYCGNVNSSTSNSSPSNYSILFTINVPANASTFNKLIPTNDLYDAGFVSGNTCAFAGYLLGSSVNSASNYIDIESNKLVYSAISPIPATSTVIVQ